LLSYKIKKAANAAFIKNSFNYLTPCIIFFNIGDKP